MTTSAFWIDVTAYGLTTLVAASLLLVVLGTGVRRALNLGFSLLMVAVGVWAGTSVALRVALWFETGTQQFWMELSTLAFMLIAPLMLVFSNIYVRARRFWPYGVVIASLVLIGVFSVPLFRHQVVANVRLESGGTVAWDRTAFSWVTSVPMLASAVLAVALLWRERQRLRESYLLVAFVVLVVFGTVFSILQVSFPTLSLVMIVVSSIMGYGVLNRQLFNPLRELTERLEERVAERTQELEKTTGELQQALRRVRRQVAYLQAAAEVARSVSAIRDVDRLLQETVRLISDHFGFYHAGVFLLDEGGEYAVLRAVSSKGGQRMLAWGHRLKVGEEGIVGYVAASGESRIALDVGEDGVRFDNPDLPDTRSQIALPLKVQDRVIGVLDVQSTEAAAFTEEDVTVLQTLADQLAVGLENARLLSQTTANLEELSRLYRVMTGEAWRQFVAGRPDLSRYEAGAAEVPEETWTSIFAQARSQGRPVSACCVEGEGGGRHALAVPVKLRGVPIGVLGFHRPVEAGEWQPEEIALAEGVAERMALGLENVRLLEEARRRAARERLVTEISARVRASLDPDAVLKTAVRELGRVLGAELAAIEMTGPERNDGGFPAEEPAQVGEE